MNRLTQSNYGRFNKLFHKGEQVVVGFREDFTHGYITKIDETGFGLFQIDKPKEYWYDWEHFEFISHPGFRFKKLPDIGEEWIDNVNVFTIKLLGDDFPVGRFTRDLLDDFPAIHYQFNNSNDIIACINKFNIKASEISSFEPWHPWANLKIKMHTVEATCEGHENFAQTLPDTVGNYDIISVYFFEEDLDFEGINTSVHKIVRDNDELDIMRITKSLRSKPRYVSSGDPWYTDEPVEKVGFNTWKSKDGFAMSNSKSILIEVVCK